MITIPTLKLNKHEEVTIPSPAELFARFGFTAKSQGNTTGDESVPMNLSKVEMVSNVARLALDKED